MLQMYFVCQMGRKENGRGFLSFFFSFSFLFLFFFCFWGGYKNKNKIKQKGKKYISLIQSHGLTVTGYGKVYHCAWREIR